MATQETSPQKNCDPTSPKLELAAHRRILSFLNDAIVAEDLVYEKIAPVHEG